MCQLNTKYSSKSGDCSFLRVDYSISESIDHGDFFYYIFSKIQICSRLILKKSFRGFDFYSSSVHFLC